MEETKINFGTKTWVKEEFFRICKEQNVNASARFNDFMRKVISESGAALSANPTSNSRNNRSVDDWRDQLVRG